jgi:hypothetical protein
MMRFTMILAAAAALTVATGAQAGVVFTPSGGLATDHDPGNPVNLGNVFTPTTTGQATSLGFYTPTNLVGGGETVALYDSAGALLTSVFVSVPVNNPGQYFFASITPVLLTAGQQYTVVNFVGQNAWAFGSVNSTGAVFNYNAYGYGPSLAYTTNSGGSGPAYFGPNLIISAVPEAATWAMMLAGFGIAGVGLRRRKRTPRPTYA